jgi:hypothetical protein
MDDFAGVTAPPQFSLILKQGADFDFTFTWLDDNGDPMNLSNFVMRLAIKPSADSLVETLSLSSASVSGSRIALGGVLGTITLYFAHADTALLAPIGYPTRTIAQGLQGLMPLGYQDLKYTDPSGNVGYLFQGPASFAPRYTA